MLESFARAVENVRLDARAGFTRCTPGKTVPCGRVCRTPPNCAKGKKGSERVAKIGKENLKEFADARRSEKSKTVPAAKSVVMGKGSRELTDDEVKLFGQKLQQLESKGVPGFVSWGTGINRLIALERKSGEGSVYRVVEGRLIKDEPVSEQGVRNIAHNSGAGEDKDYGIYNASMTKRVMDEKDAIARRRDEEARVKKLADEEASRQQKHRYAQTEKLNAISKQLKGTKKSVGIKVQRMNTDTGKVEDSIVDIDATVYGDKLAIHKPIGFNDGGYSVTQLKTGLSLGTFNTMQGAKQAVALTAGLTDGDVDNAIAQARVGSQEGKKLVSLLKMLKDGDYSEYEAPSSLPSSFSSVAKRKRKDSLRDRLDSLRTKYGTRHV